jgi:hypothetical protein
MHGEMRNTCKILVAKPEGKRPPGRPKRNGKILLKWIMRKYGGKVWNGYIWLRTGTNGELL